MDAAVGQAFSGLANALFPNPQHLAQAAELKARRDLLNEKTRNTTLEGDALSSQNQGFNDFSAAMSEPAGPNITKAIQAMIMTRDPRFAATIPGLAVTRNPRQWNPADLSTILTANGVQGYQNTPAGVAQTEQGLMDREMIKAGKQGSAFSVEPKDLAQLGTLLGMQLGTNPGEDAKGNPVAAANVLSPEAQAAVSQIMAETYQRTHNAGEAIAAAQARLEKTKEATSGGWFSGSAEPGVWDLKRGGSAVPAKPDTVNSDASAPAAAVQPPTEGGLLSNLIHALAIGGVPANIGQGQNQPQGQPTAQPQSPPSAKSSTAPQYKEGDVLVKPGTNEKIVLKGGKWVPVQ